MHCTGALAATAVSLAHVLKRCTTEDSVVLCVEVQFKCYCVCFNCISHVSSELCVRRAMTFRLDSCIIVQKKYAVYAVLTVLHCFHMHFYSCIFHPLPFLTVSCRYFHSRIFHSCIFNPPLVLVLKYFAEVLMASLVNGYTTSHVKGKTLSVSIKWLLVIAVLGFIPTDL